VCSTNAVCASGWHQGEIEQRSSHREVRIKIKVEVQAGRIRLPCVRAALSSSATRLRVFRPVSRASRATVTKGRAYTACVKVRAQGSLYGT
jgi:hypothetical protein